MTVASTTDKNVADAERARFNAEVRHRANRLLEQLAEKIGQGRLDPAVATASLMVTATNLAALHGIGPQVAAWLRDEIPSLERMISGVEGNH